MPRGALVVAAGGPEAAQGGSDGGGAFHRAAVCRAGGTPAVGLRDAEEAAHKEKRSAAPHARGCQSGGMRCRRALGGCVPGGSSSGMSGQWMGITGHSNSLTGADAIASFPAAA